jgi:hypothetical protein
MTGKIPLKCDIIGLAYHREHRKHRENPWITLRSVVKIA